jgi:hypothetical protein
MIISLIQRRSDIKYEYELIHKGNTICNSYIPITLFGREINFVINGNLVYKIESCLTDDIKRIFNYYPVYKSYLIKDGNDLVCGYIAIKQSSFWFGYLYYEVMLNGGIYTVYEVGRGKEGLFLTIFQNKMQVAQIEKDILVKDYKDTYTIYLNRDTDMTPIILFNVLYDAIRWGNRGKYGYKSTKYNYVYTKNKFVNGTYNPNFKNGIME